MDVWFNSSVLCETVLSLLSFLRFCNVHVWSWFDLQYIALSYATIFFHRLGCFLNEFHCVLSSTLRITELSFLRFIHNAVPAYVQCAMQCNVDQTTSRPFLPLPFHKWLLQSFNILFAHIHSTLSTFIHSSSLCWRSRLLRRIMMRLDCHSCSTTIFVSNQYILFLPQMNVFWLLTPCLQEASSIRKKVA